VQPNARIRAEIKDFVLASMKNVDVDATNQSENKKLVIYAYAFGAITKRVKDSGLQPVDAHAQALILYSDTFEMSNDDSAKVAQTMIDKTADHTWMAVMEQGARDVDIWMKDGPKEMPTGLSRLLAGPTPELRRAASNDADLDYKTFLARAVEELKVRTAAHKGGWHFGEEERWSVDQDQGKIVFAFKEGVTATASVQIIGTFNTEDNTWLWAWANPSVDKPLMVDALKVKAYGEQHKVSELTTRKWSGTEDDAWKMAALAAKLCGAQGAYRGPAGNTHVFMTFGQIELKKAK
jgi:hypothetical protein